MFSRPDARLAFAQVVAEIATGRYPAGEAFLSIFRQAALANLYFFLKYVASYSGAYKDLTRYLHAEVCNVRQSALAEGSRTAIILPRSSFKSTVATYGGAAWELWRDPNLRMGIFSFPAERAQGFFQQVKAVYDNNALLHELDPRTVPPRGKSTRWNDTEIVMPARTLDAPDPSLKAYTAGGATAGIHVDVAEFDDLIGDSFLNADRGATADLIKMSHWFNDNENTILQRPERSRVIFSFTRYSPADPGEELMLHACEHLGDWYNVADFYPVDVSGRWRVYYRSGLNRNGRSIFPAQYSTAFLEKLRAEQPASYALNYANDPRLKESVEFASYRIGRVELRDSPTGEELYFPADGSIVALERCSMCQALDPAATEKFVSLKTSKTAHVVHVLTPRGRHVFLVARSGFVRTTQWFDWLFAEKRRFGDLMGRCWAELVAGFKSLTDIMLNEQIRRNEWISFVGVNAMGDKDVTIRNVWQPELEKNNVYAVDGAREALQGELGLFPSGPYKDILDAGKMAIKNAIKPVTDDELAYAEARGTGAPNDGRNRTTGY